MKSILRESGTEQQIDVRQVKGSILSFFRYFDRC